MRVGRVAAAGLVWSEEDLGAFQRGDSNVLTNIGVIYPNCYTAWRLILVAEDLLGPFGSAEVPQIVCRDTLCFFVGFQELFSGDARLPQYGAQR